MIKLYTLGMYDVAKNNPVLTAEADTPNYSFITDGDGDLYLVMNVITGDKAYGDDAVIPAGEYLNGFLVEAWKGQELVVDEKHIAYGDGEDYDDITAGTTLLTVDTETGKLEIAAEAPASGVYFKATAKQLLTGNAVRVKVMVA